MTSALAGVVDRGTAASIRAAGLSVNLAGKTGTTNEGRDAWFVGYSSRLLALVWVGFDDGTPHGLSASHAAVPIWTDFMKQAVDAYPVTDFEIPSGVSAVSIDITNGYAANRFCPARRRVLSRRHRAASLRGTHEPDRPRVRARGRAWDRFRGWLDH